MIRSRGRPAIAGIIDATTGEKSEMNSDYWTAQIFSGVFSNGYTCTIHPKS